MNQLKQIPFKYIQVIILLLGLFVFALETFIYRQVSEPKFQVVFTNRQPDDVDVMQKRIYIAGAVKHPGVYYIDENEVLADTISKAEVLDSADIEYLHKDLNLASIPKDESHIFIQPKRGFSQQDSYNSGAEVNINTATLAELVQLQGVGQSTANKIISHRPYQSISQILDVPGIGEHTFENIKDKISI